MVRMSDVWDRTTLVLSGRGGALARIAFVGVFLPSVVSSGYATYTGGRAAGPVFGFLGGLVALAVLIILLWAQLALIALSTDPVNTPAVASSTALRRLGPAFAVVAVIGGVFVALLIPPFAVMANNGVQFSPALLQAGVMPTLPPGVRGFVSIYVLMFMIIAIFVSARLIVSNAVVVNERLGLGAIRRSFRLTRGLSWRIIGVLLLYGIVVFVATKAVQVVVGIVLLLLLGSDAAATVVFLTTVAVAAVSAALSTIAAAFTAQLYVATRGADWASTAL